MGLPAFQESFDALSAETQRKSEAVTRVAEVVSLTMGQLVRRTDSIVESENQLRILFINAAHLLETAIEEKDVGEELEKLALTLVTMRRFLRRISRPYFADLEGGSLIQAVPSLEAMKVPTAADGRLARRLAKRIKEKADLVERQRLRFIPLCERYLQMAEAEIKARGEEDVYRRAYIRAVGKTNSRRYPVINEYLAR